MITEMEIYLLLLQEMNKSDASLQNKNDS